MLGQQTSRWAEGMADMQMCVSRRSRGDRQGMRLVENDPVGGRMDSVPAVLGPTSDMPFVGSSTRPQEEQVREGWATEVSISGLFDGSSGNHHVPRWRRSHDIDIRQD